jgi:hypothetical protein
MILGQLNELFWWRLDTIGENLVEYMGAELLDTYFVISGLRGHCGRF